jgi:hypothetical protein
MRIAICFSGQMRTAVGTSKSILNFFGDEIDNIDIFIHTWDINTVAPRFFDGRSDEVNSIAQKIDESEFDKLNDIYSPKEFKIENWETWNTTRGGVVCRRNDDNDIGSLIPLYYSAHESNHLRVEYEKKHQVEYQWVFKMRMDVLFKDSYKISDELKWMIHRPNFFYVNDVYNRLPEFVEDIMWASTPTIMNIAVKVNMAMENDSSCSNIDWQIYFKIYLNSHNIPIKGFYRNELILCRDTTDNPILDVTTIDNEYNNSFKECSLLYTLIFNICSNNSI